MINSLPYFFIVYVRRGSWIIQCIFLYHYYFSTKNVFKKKQRNSIPSHNFFLHTDLYRASVPPLYIYKYAFYLLVQWMLINKCVIIIYPPSIPWFALSDCKLVLRCKIAFCYFPNQKWKYLEKSSLVLSLSEQARLVLLFCKQSKLDVLAAAKNLSSFHFLLYRTSL